MRKNVEIFKKKTQRTQKQRMKIGGREIIKEIVK